MGGTPRRTQRFALLSALSICLGSAVASAPGKIKAAAVEGCVPPTFGMISYLDTAVASSDSDFGIGVRNQFHLPAGPVSSVTAVTDSALCHRAAVAAGLSRDIPDSFAVTIVSVVRVGTTRYVVTDLQHHIGEFQISYVFDSAFTVPPLVKFGS